MPKKWPAQGEQRYCWAAPLAVLPSTYCRETRAPICSSVDLAAVRSSVKELSQWVHPDSGDLVLSQGIHPKVAADMLGHATVAITMNTYSHVTPGMHQAAVDALDRIVGPPG